jgi:SAM-dependent methyltransferase
MVDLGCGPCLFARHARDFGFQVTAVDARTVRIPSPEELGSIKFVHADVRDFDVSGFDLIAMLGLAYHFDIDDQISLLKRCRESGAMTIMESQVHVPALAIPQSNPPGEWETRLVSREGYEGLEFPERDNPMASVGNPISFWHTEESWLKLFENVGFSSVALIDPVFQSKYGGRRFYQLN